MSSNTQQQNIQDLMRAVEEDQLQNQELENENITQQNDALKKMDRRKINVEQKISARISEKLDRKENYDLIKDDLRQWLPIIKKNRESENLDFRENVTNDGFRMQSKANEKKKVNNDHTDKILNKQKEINIDDEVNLKKRELKSQEDQDAKEKQKRLGEVVKNKNLAMYREQKHKRMKKIKSKIYRQIKKKKKTKEEIEQQEMLAQGDPTIRLEQMEKLERERAKERITQRHKNQSKFIKQVRRYNGETQAQTATTDLHQERKKLLKKLNMDDYQELMDSDSDYNDNDYEKEAMKELEKEFLDQEESKEVNQDGMDTIDKLIKRGEMNQAKEARGLISKQKRNEDVEDDLIDDISSDDLDEDEDEKKKRKKAKLDKRKRSNAEELNEHGRKKFKTNAVIVENDNEWNLLNKGSQKAKNLQKNYK